MTSDSSTRIIEEKSANGILIRAEIDERGVKNGRYELIHPTGTTILRGAFRQGERNGVFERWNADGSFAGMSTWIDGVLEGADVAIQEGAVALIRFFSHGLPDGTWFELDDERSLVGTDYSGLRDQLMSDDDELRAAAEKRLESACTSSRIRRQADVALGRLRKA